jgi:hypothetical protein
VTAWQSRKTWKDPAMTRPRFEPRDRLVLSIALILIAISLAG